MRSSDISTFFYNLGQMLESGLPIESALQSLQQQSRPPLRAAIVDMQNGLQSGRTFSDVCTDTGSFNDMELALVDAGERSGQLDQSCKSIASIHDERRKIRNRVCLGLLYPVIILHVMFIVLAVFRWTETYSIFSSLLLLAQLIIPTYLVVFCGILIFTTQAGPLRMLGDFLSCTLPGPSGVVTLMARQRFAMVMKALYEAGVPFESSYPKAAAASGNRVLEKNMMRGYEAIQAGEPLARAMAASSLFAASDIGLVETGESSGQLDACLGRISSKLLEEAKLRMNVLMIVLIVIIFLMVAISAGALVINQYMDYWRNIDELIDSF